MKAFPLPRPASVYNPGLRAVHWLMAALIFVALPLGVWAALSPRGATRSEILFVHKSIGMTVLCLVAPRIVWRLIVGAPAYAEPLGRLNHAAARSAHIALYALMIAMPVSGYVESTGGGFRVPWFGLLSFPVLLHKDPAVRAAGSWAHFLFAWAIAFVLAAHLGAVVWHAAIRRDSVLTRMWPTYRPASSSAQS
ncbi:MAG TPA: cytochrome b [Roseiarcus sp.]|nr:cytochrome b [Roseiarcus sp.]